MKTLRLVTPPSEMPVLLDEAKVQLAVGHDDDDALIDRMIAAVTDYVSRPPEGVLGRSLCEQTLELALPCWPEEWWCGIALPFGPVSAIVSVTYRDMDNAAQTVSPSDYFLDGGALAFVRTFLPPLTYPRREAVVIRYTAGETDPALLPEGLRHALFVRIADLYANRGDGTSLQVQRDPKLDELLLPYRLWTA